MHNGEFDAQIKRIKSKLEKVRKIDTKFRVFGARTHKYIIGDTIFPEDVIDFEEEIGIKLPKDYVSFFLHIGDRGKTDQDDAAGPSYGIFPFGNRIHELAPPAELSLDVPPNISPDMTKDDWVKLNFGIENKEMTRSEEQKHIGHVYAGLLPFCHHGCGSYSCLVLSGEHVGRIVNANVDDYQPTFTKDNNFLDWYERWLDDVISGDLFKS